MTDLLFISNRTYCPSISPNPEEPAALALAVEKAKETDAELVLASDPDADRVGAAVKNNGREVAAYYVLFGYMDDIRETECFQCRRDNRHACSVDRRVDDLHVMVTCDGFR